MNVINSIVNLFIQPRAEKSVNLSFDSDIGEICIIAKRAFEKLSSHEFLIQVSVKKRDCDWTNRRVVWKNEDDCHAKKGLKDLFEGREDITNYEIYYLYLKEADKKTICFWKTGPNGTFAGETSNTRSFEHLRYPIPLNEILNFDTGTFSIE